MVAGHLLLFVGGFVFLVDDDEAQVRDGGEDGRPGADCDLGLARGQRTPGIMSLAVAQMAVPDDDFHASTAESTAQAADGLRREGDFRNEENRAAAFRDNLFDGMEIDLGLPAPRHPVKEVGGEATAVQAGAQGVYRGALLGVEGRRLCVDLFAERKRIRIGLAGVLAGELG